MKIILSRKGFDSDNGGCASPILPAGELCSLPIPESMPDKRSLSYSELKFDDQPLWEIMRPLGCNVTPDGKAHLDPDLNPESRVRRPGWKPLLGQAKAAERHLQNQGVAEGDIFLFFGWFKKVEQVGGKYHYIYSEPDLHVIFGWLQIEQRIQSDQLDLLPEWAFDHPHCKRQKYNQIDSIYVSTDRISLPNFSINKSGAGLFKKFHSALQLTSSGGTRSVWRLPKWFFPLGKSFALSYHESLKRWSIENDYTLLQSVGRGQEFVLDCDEYPESIPWIADILGLE